MRRDQCGLPGVGRVVRGGALDAPALMTATLLALSFTSAAFLPGIVTSDQKASILRIGRAVGLSAGVFHLSGAHLVAYSFALAAAVWVSSRWSRLHGSPAAADELRLRRPYRS